MIQLSYGYVQYKFCDLHATSPASRAGLGKCHPRPLPRRWLLADRVLLSPFLPLDSRCSMVRRPRRRRHRTSLKGHLRSDWRSGRDEQRIRRAVSVRRGRRCRDHIRCLLFDRCEADIERVIAFVLGIHKRRVLAVSDIFEPDQRHAPRSWPASTAAPPAPTSKWTTSPQCLPQTSPA